MKRGRKSSRFYGRRGGEKRRGARRVRAREPSFRKRRAPTRRPAKSSRSRRNDDKKTTGRFARHAPNAPFATDDGKFARRRPKRLPSPTVRQDFQPDDAPRKRSTDFSADGRKIESWRTWPSETRRSSRRGVAKSKPTFSKTSCERAASQRKRLNEAISSDFGARRTDSPERRRFNESEKLRKTAKRAVGRPPRPREKSE